jgi:hypothetical protein
MIPANQQKCTHEVMILVRIITRRDWDELQSWHRACPGSTIEHLMHGLFVLTIPTGGAGLAA